MHIILFLNEEYNTRYLIDSLGVSRASAPPPSPEMNTMLATQSLCASCGKPEAKTIGY